MTPNARSFGHYAQNRYAWLLADVRRLGVPIQAKGSLGLWECDVTEEVLR